MSASASSRGRGCGVSSARTPGSLRKGRDLPGRSRKEARTPVTPSRAARYGVAGGAGVGATSPVGQAGPASGLRWRQQVPERSKRVTRAVAPRLAGDGSAGERRLVGNASGETVVPFLVPRPHCLEALPRICFRGEFWGS